MHNVLYILCVGYIKKCGQNVAKTYVERGRLKWQKIERELKLP